MASIFTQIIKGELPGRFVWRDPQVVAFLTTAPINPGHTLIIPREEIDHWIDMPAELATQVMHVAQIVGQGIHRAYSPQKVGMMIAGLEVRHVHLHLVPINAISDLNFEKQDKNASPESLDAAARKLRDAIGELGYQKESRAQHR